VSTEVLTGTIGPANLSEACCYSTRFNCFHGNHRTRTKT